jgi:RNA polymerase sigma-70 factor (ECF subfamily)
VIILKYHHGYELKEVAKMLGITYANALSIDQRAKKKLKALCEEAELV